MRWFIDDQGFSKCMNSNGHHVDRMVAPIEAPTHLSLSCSTQATPISNLYQTNQVTYL
ncbi:hypothetical protein LINGRAPRIM_LOCUS524 [Linum grandiflorum]